MPSKVSVNNRTVVHAGSSGVAPSFPDVCKTPSPGGPVPIPYPNIAQSTDTAMGSQTVKVEGNPIMLQGSNFAQSTGDEAGATGGVVSSLIKGKAEFVNYSFDVKVEGKCVPRLGDQMVHNKGGAPNTGPFPEVQPPCPVVPAFAKLEEKNNPITKIELLNRTASPPKVADNKSFIELVLVDQKGVPYAGARFLITVADGRVIDGRLDDKGRARIDGVSAGEAHVTFPDLDEDDDLT